MEKIIITGGAGFIGSSVCRKLLSDKKYVICIDNFDPNYSPDLKKRNVSPFIGKSNFKLYQEDIRNIVGLNKIFIKENPDKIIHLAAKVGVRNSLLQPKEYEEVNVGGTLNLLELAKTFEIKQFIFGSSSSVYGNNNKVPFSEEDSANFQISPYGVTKKAGELLCRTYSHLFKIPITCLRFFTVYGPCGRPDMAPYLFTDSIYKKIPIKQYGDGLSKRDYTYIDDIVAGIISSLSKPYIYEIINLGGGETISLNKFISIIEKLVGNKAKITFLFKQPGDVNITFANIKKARKMLGFKPKYNIKEGMKKYIEWYLEHD